MFRYVVLSVVILGVFVQRSVESSVLPNRWDTNVNNSGRLPPEEPSEDEKNLNDLITEAIWSVFGNHVDQKRSNSVPKMANDTKFLSGFFEALASFTSTEIPYDPLDEDDPVGAGAGIKSKSNTIKND